MNEGTRPQTFEFLYEAFYVRRLYEMDLTNLTVYSLKNRTRRPVSITRQRTTSGKFYQRVAIIMDGITKRIGVHVLIMFAIHGRRIINRTVNHRDNDSENNRPGNLELTSQRENTIHYYQTVKPALCSTIEH